MSNKLLYFLVIACIVSVGLLSTCSSGRGTINVSIEQDKDTGIWRVRDKNGRNKGTLKVRKKDKIHWQLKGSDMIFTFSKPINRYFEHDEGQFEDNKSQRIADNEKLSLTISEDAPSDTLVYEVYVVEADTFVVGNSPPKLIIR